MKIRNDFIGNDEFNETLLFVPGDSLEQFNNNRVKQPDDWYYHNVEITYQFNNLGHRCKNFEDINQDNYLLYIGCSHTMGVGLELEKTYPYLLSEKLNMDYYNLAIPATGIDVLEYNLLTWFFKMKKPKLVIVQWPDHSRFIQYDFYNENVLERGTWCSEPDQQSFVINSEDSGMFYARKAMSNKLIRNVVDVPLLPFAYGKQQQYDIYDLHIRGLDKARDLGHSGIKSNLNFAEMLFSAIEIEGLLK